MSREPFNAEAATRIELYNTVGAVEAERPVVVVFMAGFGLASMYCLAMVCTGIRMKPRKVMLLGAIGTLTKVFWWLWHWQGRKRTSSEAIECPAKPGCEVYPSPPNAVWSG